MLIINILTFISFVICAFFAFQLLAQIVDELITLNRFMEERLMPTAAEALAAEQILIQKCDALIALTDDIKSRLDVLIATGGGDPASLQAISDLITTESAKIDATIAKDTPATTP